jgi:hypothetical protein
MHRNAVVEVCAETRKTLLKKKIRIGWQICRIADYITATRCFKCSKFNHRTQDCRGEVTCPLCAGHHILKECKGDSTTFKCTNCENYNKHNPTKNISVAHSALDRKCPSLQAVLEKNRQNTELNGRQADFTRQTKEQNGQNKHKIQMSTNKPTTFKDSY